MVALEALAETHRATPRKKSRLQSPSDSSTSSAEDGVAGHARHLAHRLSLSRQAMDRQLQRQAALVDSLRNDLKETEQLNETLRQSAARQTRSPSFAEEAKHREQEDRATAISALQRQVHELQEALAGEQFRTHELQKQLASRGTREEDSEPRRASAASRGWREEQEAETQSLRARLREATLSNSELEDRVTDLTGRLAAAEKGWVQASHDRAALLEERDALRWHVHERQATGASSLLPSGGGGKGGVESAGDDDDDDGSLWREAAFAWFRRASRYRFHIRSKLAGLLPSTAKEDPRDWPEDPRDIVRSSPGESHLFRRQTMVADTDPFLESLVDVTPVMDWFQRESQKIADAAARRFDRLADEVAKLRRRLAEAEHRVGSFRHTSAAGTGVERSSHETQRVMDRLRETNRLLSLELQERNEALAAAAVTREALSELARGRPRRDTRRRRRRLSISELENGEYHDGGSEQHRVASDRPFLDVSSELDSVAARLESYREQQHART